MKTIIGSDIEKATDVLKNGGVIIFPTETVYGIGADSRNIQACERIYSLKNRPVDNPFIVHLESVSSIDEIAFIPEKYRSLIETFSPGPITYILKKKDESIFSSGLSTIGVRIPSHPIAQAILRESKIPVSAPSANISGKPSITRAEDAINEFSGKVDFILTGQDCEIGIESTVVDLTSEIPILLRPGRISYLDLFKLIPDLQKVSPNEIGGHSKPASPGLKYRHYAPECEVILVKNFEGIQRKFTGGIGFQFESEMDLTVNVKTNIEYMHLLYSFFIDCDKNKIQKAYCQFPVQDEFEEVLLNRIEKAIVK